jgi:hypothetical protein
MVAIAKASSRLPLIVQLAIKLIYLFGMYIFFVFTLLDECQASKYRSSPAFARSIDLPLHLLPS